MPDIFIELDRDYDVPEQAPSRPSRFGKHWRPWAVAGLATLILSTLGNAEFPPDAGVELVAQFQADNSAQLMAIDDKLFLLEPELLTSYDPSTGQPRWKLQTGLFNPYLSRDGGLLLVVGSIERDWAQQPSPQESMAVDMSSGAVRWRIPGYVEVIDDLLIAHNYAARGNPDEASAVAIYTGDGQRRLWSTPPGEIPAVNLQRSILSTLGREAGELTEHNLRTGEVINRYTFPELIGANGFSYDRGLAIFFFDDGRHMRFDGVTLTPYPDVAEVFAPTPIDCGEVWCRYNADGSGYHLTDKVSGRKVYDAGDWDVVVRTQAGLLGIRHSSRDGPMPAVAVFNPRTGKALDVKGWSLLGLEHNQPVLEQIKGPIYLWAYQNQLDYFGVLRDDGVRTIGVLRHTGELRRCATAAGHVACMVGVDLVSIWRLT